MQMRRDTQSQAGQSALMKVLSLPPVPHTAHALYGRGATVLAGESLVLLSSGPSLIYQVQIRQSIGWKRVPHASSSAHVVCNGERGGEERDRQVGLSMHARWP
jgi:hypothetical protein